MSKQSIEKPRHPTVNYWVSRGSLRVKTDALEPDDPDHIYNQIVSQGFTPEEYGFTNPYFDEFKNMNRNQLIQEIVNLRKELKSWVMNA